MDSLSQTVRTTIDKPRTCACSRDLSKWRPSFSLSKGKDGETNLPISSAPLSRLTRATEYPFLRGCTAAREANTPIVGTFTTGRRCSTSGRGGAGREVCAVVAVVRVLSLFAPSFSVASLAKTHTVLRLLTI